MTSLKLLVRILPLGYSKKRGVGLFRFLGLMQGVVRRCLQEQSYRRVWQDCSTLRERLQRHLWVIVLGRRKGQVPSRLPPGRIVMKGRTLIYRL